MRATRRGDQGHQLRRWRGLGIAVAVIAVAGFTYPVVSNAFHSTSRTSAVTVNSPGATTSSADTGTTPSGQPSVTTVPGATTTATVAPKVTATTKAPPKTTAAKKTTAGSTTTAGKAGPASSTASLAGRIKPGQTRTGKATFYQGAQNTGACSFDPSPDHLTAAMNEADYEGSNACGAYIQVHGSTNGATITVRITNLCPYPCAVGQLDLDPEAYKLLAPLQTGETPITWKLVSPNLSGGIAIRYKPGSSQWWCGIQVINHRNPVARLEVLVNGAWKALPRASYNYFLSATGAGCGSQIRVTDIYGQQLTVGPLAIKVNVTQATSVQFSGH
jgi:expansin (peptidoglycan-binding protein)